MIVMEKERLLMIRRSARLVKGRKLRRKRRSSKLRLIRELLMEISTTFMEKGMKYLIVNLAMWWFKS